MNKIKDLALITVTSLAFIMMTGGAKADEHKTYTPQETIEAFASVPGKIVEHVSNEIQDTKEYQAKSWAEAKAQLQRLKTKFINTGESQ